MLTAAALSFTFEGASPGAMSCADHILPPAGSGGWRALAEIATRRT